MRSYLWQLQLPQKSTNCRSLLLLRKSCAVSAFWYKMWWLRTKRNFFTKWSEDDTKESISSWWKSSQRNKGIQSRRFWREKKMGVFLKERETFFMSSHDWNGKRRWSYFCAKKVFFKGFACGFLAGVPGAIEDSQQGGVNASSRSLTFLEKQACLWTLSA